jgi:tetratricopeptide (TPR) repeat protein
MFIDINGNTKYITKTIFNTNNSYYFLKHDSNTLTYINLVFDIYEIQKQKMDSLLKNVKNYNKAKDICNNQFEIAKNIVRNLTQETNRGNNISNLVKWNEKINKIIEIDNLLLLSNKSEKAFRVNHNIQNKLPNYYNIGTAYINIKQYEKAIYFLTRSLKNVENNNEKLKDILYNRAIAYLELDNKEKACADLIKASALGDIKSQELLKEINNNPH